MHYFRVNVIGEIEGKRKGDLIDIPASEYIQLVKEGKVGQVVQIFEKEEKAIRGKKIEKVGK